MTTIVNPPLFPPLHAGTNPPTNAILPHYQITKQTQALIPARHIEYQTIVLEDNQYLYIKKTPLEIIEKGCLDHFRTYEGIKKAIYHHTGWRRKVPIPISTHSELVAFPTHAVKDLDCCWLFYHQVETIVEVLRNRRQSRVLFKGGAEIVVNSPETELWKQMERTGYLLGLGK